MIRMSWKSVNTLHVPNQAVEARRQNAAEFAKSFDDHTFSLVNNHARTAEDAYSNEANHHHCEENPQYCTDDSLENKKSQEKIIK